MTATTEYERVCLARPSGMPEGATIPGGKRTNLDKPVAIGVAIALVSGFIGYIAAPDVPRYQLMMNPNGLVARLDTETGKVAFCSALAACMTAEAREAMKKLQQDEAARRAQEKAKLFQEQIDRDVASGALRPLDYDPLPKETSD